MPRSDEQLQDEFDDLMTFACAGDRRALGAIAIGLTAALLGEVRAELGRVEKRDGEVVAAFLMAVAEGKAHFDRARERASVWMRRVVRDMARQRRMNAPPARFPASFESTLRGREAP